MDEYQLIRSRRKTVSLSIDPRTGVLTVRAPLRTSVSFIEGFIAEKQGWIAQTRQRLTQRPQFACLELKEGASVPYLGRLLRLQYADVARIALQDDRLLIPRGVDSTAPIVRWFERQARALFDERVDRIGDVMNAHPTAIRLNHARTRWGSMSSRGSLNLNRALIHCPIVMIDYVIVHELSHMAHPDHSAQFWAHVERYMPDYRTRRAWMKEHGGLIFVLPD